MYTAASRVVQVEAFGYGVRAIRCTDVIVVLFEALAQWTQSASTEAKAVDATMHRQRAACCAVVFAAMGTNLICGLPLLQAGHGACSRYLMIV